MLATVLACSAPFIHMAFPNTKNTALASLKKSYNKGELERVEYLNKKREVTFFGYSNHRKLWYAIGKPITMLYFSMLLMYASFYVNEKQLSFALKQASVLGVGISFYFVIWAFWYRADFPKSLYFTCIGVASLFSAFFSYEIIKSRNLITLKIKLLTNHIVTGGKKHVPVEKQKEYVKDYLKVFEDVID